jgi:heparan-alpha-glucosaminide N-acetyltransferase
MNEASQSRLASLDAYRGFVMFLMMAEVMRLWELARAFPESTLCQWIRFNTTHVEWVGCSLHDMIQPSFSFLVGVALPYSLASRRARGQSVARMSIHAVWRAFLLIALGIFLRSIGKSQTNFTFEDTLTQIGLGYPFLFALGFASMRWQWTTLCGILAAYWAAFALWPAPGADFDFARLGVPPNWPHHLTGFAAHWDKNSNLGAAFDTWFLNLWPRPKPFVANGGGYLTLSFIPTLGTMIFGLIAGGWLRGEAPARAKLTRLALAGVACLAIGGALHFLGVCPIVKRIWTPTWTIFSAGVCFFLLATFYAVIDVGHWRAWAFPLVVIGMNSIAAYCMAHLFENFIASSLKTHLGEHAFAFAGPTFEHLLLGAAMLAVFWLILFWMFRQKIFLRI